MNFDTGQKFHRLRPGSIVAFPHAVPVLHHIATEFDPANPANAARIEEICQKHRSRGNLMLIRESRFVELTGNHNPPCVEIRMQRMLGIWWTFVENIVEER